jgi:hypothetical protein
MQLHTLHGQPNLSGTEDVPSRHKCGIDAAPKINAGIKIVLHETVQGPHGVGGGVERERRVMGRIVVEAGIPCFFLLEVAAVGEKESAQFRRGLSGVDASPEPVLDQCGDVATVVKVGMGQQYGVQGRRGHWKWSPVADTDPLVSLEQSAVDENPASA